MTLTLENVGLYAETLVRQVATGGRVLNYSQESLTILDDLLAASDPHFEDSSPSQRNLVVFYTGCYLGEVFAQTLGAAWQLTEDWAEASLILASQEGGIQVRPFEKIYRRLTEGAEGNSLRAYGEGLRDHFTVLLSL